MQENHAGQRLRAEIQEGEIAMKDMHANGKGKMALNTKLLIGILAVAVIGFGAVVAMPTIERVRQRAAAEEFFGKPEAPKPAPRQIETPEGTAWGNKAARGQ